MTKVGYSGPTFGTYDARSAGRRTGAALRLAPADVAIQLGHTDGGALVMSAYGHRPTGAARARIAAAMDGQAGRASRARSVRSGQRKRRRRLRRSRSGRMRRPRNLIRLPHLLVRAALRPYRYLAMATSVAPLDRKTTERSARLLAVGWQGERAAAPGCARQRRSGQAKESVTSA